LVLAIASVAVVLVRHDRATSSAPARSPAATRQREAREVAVALRRLADDPQALVAAGAQVDVAGRARQAVPTGSSVVADERSWAPDGVGGGTILVTIRPPDRPASTYAAVMVNEGGSWKVLATVRVDDAAPATSSTR
jgi:hypothetical protein